jgi:parallel beta-helix repeat protein
MSIRNKAVIDSQLKEIGYIDDIPMAIKATENYHIKSEQELLDDIRKPVVLSKDRDLLSAAALSFPQSEREGFELVIDDDFLFQQRGVVLQHCKHFKIIFSDVEQQIHKEAKFLIEIRDCQYFMIENIDVVGGRNTVVISESSDFHIRHCKVEKADGYAIIIHNSTRFKVTKSLFKANLASGVMVLGESSQGLISECRCEGTTGYFNFDAAIHLCATSKAIGLDNIPEKCHEALSILQKVSRPHGIVIEDCVLTDGRAQGIYLEGAINCLMKNNVITKNNKEGVCFDWGSSYNIFKYNHVSYNGERNKLSKEEIIADFISRYPVLKDGSSSMKLAGISVDNGSMNDFIENKITKNYGGGVKLVRSALFNRVEGNLIGLNSLGKNKFEPLFYAISIAGLGSINNEFDSKAVLLDFLPSQLNIFARNIIRGNGAGEFFYSDKKSIGNILINNMRRFYYVPIFMGKCFFVKNIERWKGRRICSMKEAHLNQ